MEDHDIVELYFRRDETAIVETQKKYGRLCHSIAERITSDACDAEECVNDVYLGLWQVIPPHRPNSLCAFVAKIARNQALIKLKHRNADKRTPDALLSLHELEEVIPDPETFEHLEDERIGHWIGEFLKGEKEEIRNLFIRKYWYFDSIQDLSQKFGYSETKIKSILFRTRKKLKLFLTEKGVAL